MDILHGWGGWERERKNVWYCCFIWQHLQLNFEKRRVLFWLKSLKIYLISVISSSLIRKEGHPRMMVPKVQWQSLCFDLLMWNSLRRLSLLGHLCFFLWHLQWFEDYFDYSRSCFLIETYYRKYGCLISYFEQIRSWFLWFHFKGDHLLAFLS